jgi:hypothetical protein
LSLASGASADAVPRRALSELKPVALDEATLEVCYFAWKWVDEQGRVGPGQVDVELPGQSTAHRLNVRRLQHHG